MTSPLFQQSSSQPTPTPPSPARSALSRIKDPNNLVLPLPTDPSSMPSSNQTARFKPPIVDHEPTMSELLAATSGPGLGPYLNDGAGFMSDVRGDNGVASWRKGQGFRAWESAVLSNPEVKRKANVAQLYFYDYCKSFLL